MAARSSPPLRGATPSTGDDGRAGRALRVVAVAAILAAAAWASLKLATVDAALGPVTGAQRWMQTVSADAGFDPPGGRRAARQALQSVPIDGRAYRALAQVAEAEGDDEHAHALWDIAVARAPRDAITRARLTEMALAHGEYDRGIAHLDALMRVSPQLQRPLLRVVVPYLDDAALRQALLPRLALDPPWRSGLAPLLGEQSAAPAAAEALLGELAARMPPTPEELEARTALLRQLGRPAEARQLWLASLPEDLQSLEGQPFDGGFEGAPTRGAYGWRWDPRPGVAIRHDRSSAHAGGQSLLLEFSGRETHLGGPYQTLQLAPGSHRLQAAADNRTGNTRPFQWELRCGNQTVVELPLATTVGWSEAATVFELPPGCPEQTLQLRHLGRNLAERQLRGSLWLDQVDITPH